ncbi:MAG: class I SAM-dependent methyltransferase [Acetobacteraceae bacterium]
MSLWSDFLTNDQRQIHKWTHFVPAYERHLSRYANRPVLLIEIGCGDGGSLQMWKRFLGPHAQIVGVDIHPDCAGFEEPQIAVRIGHQADEGFLGRVLEEFGAPDIVIDDGTHVMQHMLASFRVLYPRMAGDGVYVAEDLHTCYWPEFGGGLRREGTFIEICKALLDELNADLSRGAVAPTGFTRSTLSMHFYDSMAVFERGRHMPKHAPRIGREGTTQ